MMAGAGSRSRTAGGQNEGRASDPRRRCTGSRGHRKQSRVVPHLAHVALVVSDYDEALAFYVGKLGFTLVDDMALADQSKRWVTIRPPGADATATTLLLARAAQPQQVAAIGNQAGGRVFLFLQTDDFERDFAAFTAAGVRFIEAPRREPYGIVAVFEDLYGNRWDLIECA